MPLKAALPMLDWVTVRWNGAAYRLPYCFRKGNGGPALLFVHGLGGAKENFYAAFQSPALADCDLLAFDFPGTGLAEFDPGTCPGVGTLAEITHLVWKTIIPHPVFLVLASMGGLIGLLMIRRYGSAGIEGLINIEGNLAREDCMFSRRVTSHTFDELSSFLFRQIQSELRTSRYPGDHMIAHNMALNIDIRAYFQYSFETVRESDAGRLLEEFIAMNVPRLFLYGDANRSLSYIPKLRASNAEVFEVSQSAHFLFYDNPVETFDRIGKFVAKHSRVAH